MAIGDVIEFVVEAVCAGQQIINVLHFRMLSNEDPNVVIANTFDTTVKADLLNVVCNDYNLVQYILTKVLPTPRGPSIGQAAVGTGTASGGASALPASALVKWTTAVGGRSGRGRTYFGPIPGAQGVDGLLDSTLEGNLLDVKNALVAWNTEPDPDSEFGILSRLTSTFNPVTGGTPRNQIKTQRRRQIGVGS